MTDLSTSFVALAPDAVDDAIQQAMAAIGGFIGVDRAYVFRIAETGATMDNTHEWCAPGIEPQIANLQDIPIEMFPWWMDQLRRGENIRHPPLPNCPQMPQPKRVIFGAARYSIADCCASDPGAKLAGFLGFDAVRIAKRWTDDDIALLRIVGEMIVNALDRCRTEDALRKSERVYRALFERTNDVFIISLDGRHLAVNHQASQMLGYTADELLGKTIRDVVVPLEYASADRVLDRLLADEQVPVYERTFRCKDGTHIRVEINAALVRNARRHSACISRAWCVTSPSASRPRMRCARAKSPSGCSTILSLPKL